MAPRQGWNPAEPAPKRFRQEENRRRAPLRGNRQGWNPAEPAPKRFREAEDRRRAPLKGNRHGKSTVPLVANPHAHQPRQ